MITSASGSYIVGSAAVRVTGALAEHRWDRGLRSARCATGNVVIYLVGLPCSRSLNTNLEQTLGDSLYPFVPGDLFEACARPRCCRQRGAA